MGGELNKTESITVRGKGVKGAAPPAGGTKNGAGRIKAKLAEDNHMPTSPKKKKNNKENIVRKKEKIAIVAKNKSTNINEEIKVLELIQEKNPKKIDYDLIYDSIGKHFFSNFK